MLMPESLTGGRHVKGSGPFSGSIFASAHKTTEITENTEIFLLSVFSVISVVLWALALIG